MWDELAVFGDGTSKTYPVKSGIERSRANSKRGTIYNVLLVRVRNVGTKAEI